MSELSTNFSSKVINIAKIEKFVFSAIFRKISRVFGLGVCRESAFLSLYTIKENFFLRLLGVEKLGFKFFGKSVFEKSHHPYFLRFALEIINFYCYKPSLIMRSRICFFHVFILSKFMIYFIIIY